MKEYLINWNKQLTTKNTYETHIKRQKKKNIKSKNLDMFNISFEVIYTSINLYIYIDYEEVILGF